MCKLVFQTSDSIKLIYKKGFISTLNHGRLTVLEIKHMFKGCSLRKSFFWGNLVMDRCIFSSFLVSLSFVKKCQMSSTLIENRKAFFAWLNKPKTVLNSSLQWISLDVYKEDFLHIWRSLKSEDLKICMLQTG